MQLNNPASLQTPILGSSSTVLINSYFSFKGRSLHLGFATESVLAEILDTDQFTAAVAISQLHVDGHMRYTKVF